jgi:hypothetical protein
MIFRKTFAKENTEKGFKDTGIHAFNEIFIGDEEFLPAYVTLSFSFVLCFTPL